MAHSFRKRTQYRFEQFMAKGGSSIFLSLLITFLVVFGVIILIRFLILWFTGPVPEYNTVTGFWDHIWYTFLQMTDPGNMYQDSETNGWIRVTTVIAGFAGVILFSALIAFITTSLDNLLYKFRKGRGIILEENHTLILGWNERVVDIIRELIIANESEKSASVVVCSEMDKEDMDDFIINRLPDTKTTKIITTNGIPTNINELKRISAIEAKSAIILSSCSDSATYDEKILSDTQVIKTIMALLTLQNGENKLPIISEVHTEQKRNIVNFFDDGQIIALDNWDIMGKLLVQTSLTSGLEMVYSEILSFDLNEIYYYNAKWNEITFGELPYHFEDGVPMGVYKSDDTLMMRPDNDYKLADDDEILILADDDSTIHFKPQQLYKPKELEYEHHTLEQRTKSTLVLGWHNVANIFIRESNDYLKEGSNFDVMIHNPTDEIIQHIEDIDKEYPDLKITLHNENTLVLENLKKLNPFTYDSIIILSQDPTEEDAEKVDSDTLMILLLLRKIAKDADIRKNDVNTKIITQVLNSDNQELILQTDVDDFIISNKLITMILAQLSEEPKIKKLYDDIFQEDGSEIYVKPATLYFKEFPVKQDFATIMEQVRKRDEICLGVRYQHLHRDVESNFGVSLNIPKDQVIEISENDFIVVLAEDEL
ncbi:MAG: hypothetical protein C0592_08925 [Marinilabiliales bacterium]|nr:MAG: hypothetical protein C0592_08925 [Marinilabiliales bacterium]